MSISFEVHGRPSVKGNSAGFRPDDFRVSGGGWDAVGGGRRARSWNPPRLSDNALLSFTGEELRAKSADVYRRNPWAWSGVESWVSNVVGDGMWPYPRIEQDETRSEWIEAWDEFSEACDADERVDINGMQEAVVRSMSVHGECFIRIRRRTAAAAERLGLEVPLQFQMIPANQVDYTYNSNISKNRIVRNGIEFNRFGRRLGYWMWTENPHDMFFRQTQEIRRVRVPAEDMIHVFHQLHPGQMRGIPGLASVLATLFELGDVADAAIVRAKVQNMMVGVIEKPIDESNPLGGGWDGYSDEDDVPMAPMEPGTWQELLPGESVKFNSPPASNGEYEQFIVSHLRSTAVGIGALYEHMTGDYKGVTFSSMRAALIELRRRVSKFQRNVLVYGFTRRAYREFAMSSMLSGRLSQPADMRIQRLLRPTWVARPAGEFIDPLKEAKATRELIDAGVTTRSQEILKYGFDPVELDKERQREHEREKEFGLEQEMQELDNLPGTNDDEGEERDAA